VSSCVAGCKPLVKGSVAVGPAAAAGLSAVTPQL
jgi:hypothetical protein